MIVTFPPTLPHKSVKSLTVVRRKVLKKKHIIVLLNTGYVVLQSHRVPFPSNRVRLTRRYTEASYVIRRYRYILLFPPRPLPGPSPGNDCRKTTATERQNDNNNNDISHGK